MTSETSRATPMSSRTAEDQANSGRTKTTPTLRLRLIDPAGQVRLLRVNRRKCSFGNASSCTIRLEGSDLRPVHCLIVTGKRDTVVRNLSPGNLLNHQPFADAVLRAGDTIQMADYRLEVLSLPSSRRPSRRSASPHAATSTLQLASAIESRMNRLEEQLFHMQREQTTSQIGALRQTIDQLQVQLERQRRKYFQERKQWRVEQKELVGRLETYSRQVDQLDAQASRLREQVAANQSEAQQATQAAAQAELENQLHQLQAALDQSLAEQQGQQRIWEEERGQLQHQLDEARRQIRELETELQASRPPSTADALGQAELETQTADLAREVAILTEELKEVRSQHERGQAEWDETQNELQAQLASCQEQLAARTAELQTARSELEGRTAELAAAEQSLENERELGLQAKRELEEELSTRRSQAAAWQSEREKLAARGEELERQLAELQQGSPQAGTADADWEQREIELRRELEAATEAHEIASRVWEAERRDWQAKCEALENAESQNTSTPHHDTPAEASTGEGSHPTSELERPAELDMSMHTPMDWGPPQGDELEGPESMPFTGMLDDSAWPHSSYGENDDRGFARPEPENVMENETPPPSSAPAPPPNTAKVLERFGFTVEEDDETAPATAESKESPPVEAPIESDGDDTIEDYMHRLLNRVRGEQSVDSMPPPPIDRGRAPIIESPPLAGQDASEGNIVEQQDVSEFIPRRPAPEKDLSLQAMRNLANESARSALQSHAERSWTDAAKNELFVAALGATCGIATFISLDTRPLAGYTILILGLGIAGVSWLRAMDIRRRLLGRVEKEKQNKE